MILNNYNSHYLLSFDWVQIMIDYLQVSANFIFTNVFQYWILLARFFR